MSQTSPRLPSRKSSLVSSRPNLSAFASSDSTPNSVEEDHPVSPLSTIPKISESNTIPNATSRETNFGTVRNSRPESNSRTSKEESRKSEVPPNSPLPTPVKRSE